MKSLVVSILFITVMTSCNIKEAKNHDNSPIRTQTSELTINTNKEHAIKEDYERLDIEQVTRNELWNKALDSNEEIDNRLKAIEEYFNSFNESFIDSASDYTILVLKNEIFKRLEYFYENIKRIRTLNITKNHINTKKGKLKDIYSLFTKKLSTNEFLFNSLIKEDFLKKTNTNITNYFLKNIVEIKLFNALMGHDDFEIEIMSQREIEICLNNLEQANRIKIKLKEKGFSFKINKPIRKKLQKVVFSDFQLDTNQDALQIQKYIDLFLN